MTFDNNYDSKINLFYNIEISFTMKYVFNYELQGFELSLYMWK